jgi:hypothetical protein
MMRQHVVATALVGFLSSAFGCDSSSSSSPDAAPPDAAVLTIGEICDLLTPVTCESDAECFDFYPLPCSESFRDDCCEDKGSCSLVNGVLLEQVMACIAAMESATCEEIDQEFPESCRNIVSSPDAVVRSSGGTNAANLWQYGQHRAE